MNKYPHKDSKTKNSESLLLERIFRFLRRSFVIQSIFVQRLIKSLAIRNFHAVENLTRERALKIINKISQAKFSASSVEELALLTCQKLQEDFGGKFWIVFKNGESGMKPYPSYNQKMEEVLNKMLPDVIYKKKFTVYFKPMTVIDIEIGVLIAELKSSDKNTASLGKILPILSNQISMIIDNFETHTKLHEAIVNEEREKLRALILSSISHDLKTPLFSIIGSLNILKLSLDKNRLTKENKKILINTALEEAERLNGFISDVLEMTRIESGAIMLHKKLLNPAMIILQTLERFDEKLKEYQLEIALSKKIKINFDKVSLEQIIQNLIDNTIKYSPENSKITICDELSQDQKSYNIFIKDEGGGIEPEKLGLIFNKFERFNLEDKVLGSGLGLSIVKALMDINNAKIIVKNSDDKKGAIFVLEFRDFVKKVNL